MVTTHMLTLLIFITCITKHTMEITNVAFYEISRKCSGFYRRGNCVKVYRHNRKSTEMSFMSSLHLFGC